VKFGRDFETCKRTGTHTNKQNKQTNKHKDTLVAILRTPFRQEVRRKPSIEVAPIILGQRTRKTTD